MGAKGREHMRDGVRGIVSGIFFVEVVFLIIIIKFIQL
jgi:hypothetical protein